MKFSVEGYFKTFVWVSGVFFLAFFLFQFYLLYQTETYFEGFQKQQLNRAWTIFQKNCLSKPQFSEIFKEDNKESLIKDFFISEMVRIEKSFHLDAIAVLDRNKNLVLASPISEAFIEGYQGDISSESIYSQQFEFEKSEYRGTVKIFFSVKFPELVGFQKNYLKMGFFLFLILFIGGSILVRQNFLHLTSLQKKIADSKKMAQFGAVAGGVAHDIRNPLGIVHLKIQQLLDLHQRDEETEFHLKDMLLALQRINYTVGTLLVFGKENIELTDTIDPKSIVDKILDQEDWGIETKITLEKVDFLGNRDLFYRMIENLFRNAVESIEVSGCDNGLVEITGFIKKDKLYRLEVRDNGTGIKNTEDLFSPFETTKENGTGLGLMIVKDSVERHRGQYGYFQLKKGACFWVEIPIFH